MESNHGVWTGLFLQGAVSPSWGWTLENQLRLHEGWASSGGQPNGLETRANRWLLRPSLRWMPREHPRLQLSIGWGWTPNLSPTRDEHRLWEQAQFQGGDANEGWAWQGRIRLEQRHIEATRGLQHRVRAYGRASRMMGDTKFYGVTAWSELFWNLNAKANGPARGLDQTRIFVGPTAQIAPSARVEMGYLNVYYPRGSARDSLMSHVLGTYMTLDLP